MILMHTQACEPLAESLVISFSLPFAPDFNPWGMTVISILQIKKPHLRETSICSYCECLVEPESNLGSLTHTLPQRSPPRGPTALCTHIPKPRAWSHSAGLAETLPRTDMACRLFADSLWALGHISQSPRNFPLKHGCKKNERQPQTRIPASDKPQLRSAGVLGIAQHTEEFVTHQLATSTTSPLLSPLFQVLHFFPVNIVWLQMPLRSWRFISNR